MRKRHLARLLVWTLQADNRLRNLLAQRLMQHVVAACLPLRSMERGTVCRNAPLLAVEGDRHMPNERRADLPNRSERSVVAVEQEAPAQVDVLHKDVEGRLLLLDSFCTCTCPIWRLGHGRGRATAAPRASRPQHSRPSR